MRYVRSRGRPILTSVRPARATRTFHGAGCSIYTLEPQLAPLDGPSSTALPRDWLAGACFLGLTWRGRGRKRRGDSSAGARRLLATGVRGIKFAASSGAATGHRSATRARAGQ